MVDPARAKSGAQIHEIAPNNTIYEWHLGDPKATEAASVHLALYDARGRLVRSLLEGERPAGASFVDWDGRDQAGRDAAAGLYFVRFQARGRGVVTSRLGVVR